MTTKALILRIVHEMPEDLSVDDFLEQLEFRLHVVEGLRQLDVGEGVPHEQVKEQLAQWLT